MAPLPGAIPFYWMRFFYLIALAQLFQPVGLEPTNFFALWVFFDDHKNYFFFIFAIIIGTQILVVHRIKLLIATLTNVKICAERWM